MLIRTEIGVDAASIEGLLLRSFPTPAEAELVQQLRVDGLLTLGVVATDDEGQVLGYAAFSPVTVNGEDLQWVALAPVAVDEQIRGQGLGQQLIREGLDTLNEFGYAAVVVRGDADWYGRLGFTPAASQQLTCRWPDSATAFRIHPLADGVFDGVAGEVEYAAPFSRF